MAQNVIFHEVMRVITNRDAELIVLILKTQNILDFIKAKIIDVKCICFEM